MYARVARSKEAVNLFIKFLYNMYRWVSGLESQDVLIKYNHTYGQDYGSDPTFSVTRSNSRLETTENTFGEIKIFFEAELFLPLSK